MRYFLIFLTVFGVCCSHGSAKIPRYKKFIFILFVIIFIIFIWFNGNSQERKKMVAAHKCSEIHLISDQELFNFCTDTARISMGSNRPKTPEWLFGGIKAACNNSEMKDLELSEVATLLIVMFK